MERTPQHHPDHSFQGHEERYFEWSRQEPAPEIWTKVEKPALEQGLEIAIESLQKPRGELRALDIGIGGGKILDLFQQLGILIQNTTGLDISPKIVELVQAVFPEHDLRVADITDESVVKRLADKAPFDIITAGLVFNHLDDEQLARALSHVYELLTDRGFFIGLVPYPNKPSKWSGLAEDKTGYWLEEDEAPWGGTVVYRHRSFTGYSEYLELSGFGGVTLKAFALEDFPNRLLLMGQKWPDFKEKLEEEALGPGSIRREHFVPEKYRK